MDIYFRPEYGKLCELLDNGETVLYEYSNEYGSISNMFIKRRIPISLEGKYYYDITTPYGYGGPMIQLNKECDMDDIIRGYNLAFDDYCKQNDIVSEFIRFHPLYSNAIPFKGIYNCEYMRKTVGTDLTVNDPFSTEFSKGCRKKVRKILNTGVSYKVIREPDNLDKFIEIYYATMQRDNASEYYYFSKEYFNRLLEVFKNSLVLVEAVYEGKVIAASLCMVSEKNIHIHLSGTLEEYLHLSPAYILRYAITIWGKENGYSYIHHGGGTSNSPENSLYVFKKQFGNNTYDFYIGKNIRNQAIYEKLCEVTGNQSENNFFPAYRKR